MIKRQSFQTVIYLSLSLLIVFIGCSRKLYKPERSLAEKELAEALVYLDEHSDDDSTRFDLANQALDYGDTSLYLEIIRPIALDIDNYEYRKRLIDIVNVKGELDLAKDLLQREIVLSGRRGGLLTRQKETDDRIMNAKKAAELGDNSLISGNWKKAFQAFRVARQLHEGKKEYSAKLKLAQAELVLKNKGKKGRKEALKYVEMAKEFSPDLALAYWIEGDLLLTMGKNKAARKAFNKSLEMGIEPPYSIQAKAVSKSKE